MTKTETIENIEIKYKKHCFSKNIKITLKQDNSILVTMPKFCPYKSAREFLLANFERIKTFKTDKPLLNENLKTKFDSLKIIKFEGSKRSIETKKGVVYFYYSGDLSHKDNQKALREAYLKALKIEAKNYLPQRLSFLAKKFGFEYQKVALKNQKTRFGSCSYCNNINLNINLMRYDFDVIDYVLIHELVHTKIKNHSSAFWLEVEGYCPDYKRLKKELKSF